MLNYEAIKEINERILEKAVEKSNLALDNGGFDAECFEVMSKVIDNIKDLDKLKVNEAKEEIMVARQDPNTTTTEFEALVYEIALKDSSTQGMINITTVLAETMEDMRLLNNKMYVMTMRRLKDMLG